MMVDFMDRDDQEMVNIQTEILEKAAQHHLHIQFHGAYKPTGLSRTYPNEFTREGTLNYETDKWDPEGLPLIMILISHLHVCWRAQQIIIWVVSGGAKAAVKANTQGR
jgi:hypothetical protein